MTHAELVTRAVRWLKNSRKCSVVLSEVDSYAPTGSDGACEQADAIGWYKGARNAYSILVECKASLSDFYADRQKPFRRRPELGMGHERWFLVPPGLVDPRRHTVPDGWGLLEARPRIIRKVVPAAAWTQKRTSLLAEIALLVATIRRQQIRLAGQRPPQGSKEPTA